MERTYELTVFNTVTGEYEKVSVSKEVFQAYMRTGWNIKDNDKSFYDHEIQFSALIGGEEGSYENFSEFIDSSANPEVIFSKQDQIRALHTAISKLTNQERELIIALFYEGQTEQSYAESLGLKQQTIHKKKERILKKIKNSLFDGC